MSDARPEPGAPALSGSERLESLRGYLAPRLGAAVEEVAVERLTDGHSNLTYLVRTPAASYVLRRPPLGPLPPNAHDVLREFRVLSLLDGQGARTPKPILACPDAEVMGAPFYLMEHVDGFVIRDALPAGADSPEAASQVTEEMIDALVELHAVDWRRAEFDSLAPTEGYLARQLRLWNRQWGHNRTRELELVPRIGAWLEENLPPTPEVTIVHGDYKLDNVIFALDRGRPRAQAIVDWEMATLGDPLADLGFLTAIWTEPGEDPALLLDLSRVTASPGFGSRTALADRYAERSGRDPANLRWYQVLAIWKLAILLEGSYKRHLAGTTDDPWFTTLEAGVPMLVERAWSQRQKED